MLFENWFYYFTTQHDLSMCRVVFWALTKKTQRDKITETQKRKERECNMYYYMYTIANKYIMTILFILKKKNKFTMTILQYEVITIKEKLKRFLNERSKRFLNQVTKNSLNQGSRKSFNWRTERFFSERTKRSLSERTKKGLLTKELNKVP